MQLLPYHQRHLIRVATPDGFPTTRVLPAPTG
jgi:hypothetical protein